MMEFRYKGLVLEVPDDVYFPAEDSTMLADAASTHCPNNSVLEIGCGSGINSLISAKAGAKDVLGVDISPEAVRCASENAKTNKIQNAHFIEGDMFEKIPKDKSGNKRFDLILFNPPYLPTAEDERLGGHINDAFDGGSDGRKVLDRFLEDFEKYLTEDGTLLLVQSSLNDLDKTKSVLASKGFGTEILTQHNFFFEKLFLIRSTRKKAGDRSED